MVREEAKDIEERLDGDRKELLRQIDAVSNKLQMQERIHNDLVNNLEEDILTVVKKHAHEEKLRR